MDKKTQVYSKGDWVVHRLYGIGQVVGIEKKRLNQKKKRFYKIRTKDSTYWLPVEKAINSRVDPLPSRRMIKRSLAVLKKPPRKMSQDTKERRKRIQEVKSEGNLMSAAKLVRDLTARRSKTRLNVSEQKALEHLKNRIIEPWSIRMDIKKGKARRQMNQWIASE